MDLQIVVNKMKCKVLICGLLLTLQTCVGKHLFARSGTVKKSGKKEKEGEKKKHGTKGRLCDHPMLAEKRQESL